MAKKRIPKEYAQQPGENYMDWKYRLLLGKAKKEIKLTWDEITTMLGLSCSGNYLRKTVYGIEEYITYIKSKRGEDSEHYEIIRELDELERGRLLYEKEKLQLQDQKRELRAILREYSRAEHIRDEIVKAIKDTEHLKPFELKLERHTPKLVNDKREGALLLSDWHKGLLTNNYWNVFNDSEFIRRVRLLVKKVLQYSQEQNVGILHVFLLGDLVNGLIHVITRITNSEDCVRQTQIVAEILSEVLYEMAKSYKKIYVYSTRGNHERITPNKKDSIAHENFFEFIPWYLKARLQSVENIEFAENKYSEEIAVAKICNKTAASVHGNRDSIKGAVYNLSLMLRTFPDYIFMAHTHHHEENEIHGCEIIRNPSLSGTDDFAVDNRTTSKPAQKFIVFDNNEGKLCTYNVVLNK